MLGVAQGEAKGVPSHPSCWRCQTSRMKRPGNWEKPARTDYSIIYYIPLTPCHHTATSDWARILELGILQPRDSLGTARHWEFPFGKGQQMQLLGKFGTMIGSWHKVRPRVSLPSSCAGDVKAAGAEPPAWRNKEIMGKKTQKLLFPLPSRSSRLGFPGGCRERGISEFVAADSRDHPDPRASLGRRTVGRAGETLNGLKGTLDPQLCP